MSTPRQRLRLTVLAALVSLPSKFSALIGEPLSVNSTFCSGSCWIETLNGKPVSRLNFEGVATNAAGTVAVSRWNGVDLVDGANELRAVIRNEDGSKAKGIRRTIHFSGGPIRAEFVPERSSLVADGNRPRFKSR